MFLSAFTDELGLDIAEALPIIKSWGLDYVDLRGRVFGRHFEGLSAQQLRELKGLLDGHGLKVGCLQASLAKVHLPDAARQAAEMGRLEGIIRAADALGCRLVRSFFYWQPPVDQRGQLAESALRRTLQQVVDMFRPLAERAREADLVLAFENCGVTTDEVAAVLEALGRPTWGLAWDVRNEWRGSPQRQQNEARYVQRMARLSRVVHVKARGAVQGLEEAIPYDRVLEALHNSGYEGPVSVETHNPDRSVDDADQTRNVVKALRRAWPSAAPGAVDVEEPRYREVTRDYEPVGFVIVGLGMGKSRARQVQLTPGARLVGVVDIDKRRAEQVGEELDVAHTGELDPWLGNDEVEVVYAMTPTGRHAEVALRALEAGKHVLTTKPMEASIQACDAMIRAAKDAGLLLAVDFDRRFRADILCLKAAVEGGVFGRLLSGHTRLSARRTMAYFRSDGGWRGTRRLDGGGVLSNQNIHHLDEVAFTIGIPRRVRCTVWTQDHNIEAEDLAIGLLEFADGLVISLYATTSYPQPTWYHELELHGTDGAFSMASGGPLEQPRMLWFAEGAWRSDPPRTVEPEWLNAADNMAAAVRTGAPLVCSGRDGRRTQSILHALYESAYGDQGWVNVEPEAPA